MTSDNFKTGGGIDALSNLRQAESNADRLVGRELGDYRIVELIAEGGMGRVYLAERRDGSFERQVALKVAPGSSLSIQLGERFRTEQGVLASLNHPNIAQLYDARVSEEGWPYFVMEYVDGGSITQFCMAHSLSLRDRIGLLIEVVDAVAFAHARLIVHRDIKPGNVLVNTEGRPKLLDFGIAKLLETDAASLTRGVAMTPRYASPEQLLHQPITTAVDTYQLGLLLYEVLTGEPLNADTTLPEAVARARQKRALEVSGGARRALPREVVRIIEHCLRADAEDRYRDAGALRDDLQAYLDGFPVKAVGQGTGYRLSKAIRRNWLPLSMTALIILGTTAALIQSTIQRDRLETTQAALQRITEFQQDMLLGIDAQAMGDRLRGDIGRKLSDTLGETADDTVGDRLAAALEEVNFTDVSRQTIDRNILSGALATIDDSFADDLMVASALRDVVSDVYEALGMYDQALPLRERIVADREQVLGRGHPDTLTALESLGAVFFDLGQYAEAAEAFERAYLTRRDTQGPDHKDTVAALGDYGNMLIDLNRIEDAERILTEALQKSRQVFGERHWSTGSVLTNLGYLYYMQGRYGEVLPLWEEALDINKEAYGAEHPETLASAVNLAAVYEETGGIGDAEKLYRETLAVERKALGETHPSVLGTMNNLAINLRVQQRYDEAGELLQRTASAYVRELGGDHPDSIRMSSNYTMILLDLGRAKEAETLLVELIDRAGSVLPPEHDILGVLHGRYGRSLRLQGRFEEAEAALLESRRILIDVIGTGGERRKILLQRFADLYEDWGRPEKRRAILAEMESPGD